MTRLDARFSVDVRDGICLAVLCCTLSGCDELGLKPPGAAEQPAAAEDAVADASPVPEPLNLPPMEGAGRSDPARMSDAEFAEHFLTLAPNVITDADLVRAANTPQLVNELTRLDLRAAQVTAEGLTALSRLGQLRELNLAGTILAPADWAALGNVSQLETLSLESAGIGDNALGFLQELANLRRLSLRNCNLTDISFRHMGNLTRLEELDVTGVQQFTGAGMEVLGPKGAGAPLRILHATGTKFGVFGFQYIGHLKSLEEFAAGATGVTDDGIAVLKGNSDLRVLHVGGNVLTDQGLRGIATFRALEDLDISGHPMVSDAALGRIGALRQLQRLNLEGTSCTLAGVEDLKKSLPNCRVRFGGMEY